MSEIRHFQDDAGNVVTRRKALAALLGVTASVALGACSGEHSPAPRPETAKDRREKFADQPSWEYDFAKVPEGAIDPAVWYARLGPNNPSTLQVNTNKRRNLQVSGGRLRIRAINEPIEGREYSSARIDTSRSHSFTYGKIEIDAQLAQGDGELDAFWMLATKSDPRVPHDISDPAVSGEIDIVEHPGKEGDVAHFNLHTYRSLSEQQNGLVQGKHDVPGCSDTLNTYGVEWSPDFIAWTVNGQEVALYRKPQGAGPQDWPFDTPHYLIMQLTMGGNFAGSVDNAPGQWETSVAAVRYYPLKSADQPTVVGG